MATSRQVCTAVRPCHDKHSHPTHSDGTSEDDEGFSRRTSLLNRLTATSGGAEASQHPGPAALPLLEEARQFTKQAHGGAAKHPPNSETSGSMLALDSGSEGNLSSGDCSSSRNEASNNEVAAAVAAAELVTKTQTIVASADQQEDQRRARAASIKARTTLNLSTVSRFYILALGELAGDICDVSGGLGFSLCLFLPIVH